MRALGDDELDALVDDVVRRNPDLRAKVRHADLLVNLMLAGALGACLTALVVAVLGGGHAA